MVIAVVSGRYEMVPLDSGWGLWYSGADRERGRYQFEEVRDAVR